MESNQKASCTERSRVVSMFLFASLVLGGPAYSHGIGQVTQSAPIAGSEEEDDAIVRGAHLSPNIETALYSVIRRDLVWVNKDKLTVCFGPIGVAQSRRVLLDQIVAIANEWTRDIPVKFDFGSPAYRMCESGSSADIRVDVRVPHSSNEAVFQSLIGNEAASASIKGDEPYSMQLLFPERAPYFARIEVVRFYVLHEFGHALGASHEHQRIDCDWDYDYVADHFGFSDPSTAKSNIEKVFSYDASAYPDVGATVHAGYIESKYDQYSVMKYNMSTTSAPSGDDPGVYHDGTRDKCYRGEWVSKLTNYDKAGIKLAYANLTAVATLLASLAATPEGTALSSAAKSRLQDQRLGRAPVVTNAETAAVRTSESALANLKNELRVVRNSPKAMAALNKILERRAGA